MHPMRQFVIVSAVSLLATAACRLAADIPAADLPTVDLPEGALPWPTDPGDTVQQTIEAAMAESGFLVGENARWPADIPADIPPLEGEIDRVTVIPGVQYRISYSRVSKEALSDYLEGLEALGFQLEYIVYTAPNIPDEQTQEKIARGEWDAVDITKGPYSMRLEPGDEGAWLDINNADFMTPGPPPVISPTPIVWPSDIPERVSLPDACRVSDLAILGGHEAPAYQVHFECPDGVEAQTLFIEALLAAGLKETDRLVSDTDDLVQLTLEDSEITVTVLGASPTYFAFQIWATEP